MGVNHWLAKYAARRAHVFIAELPGDWALRTAAQDLIAARGWRQAVSPADADVLAVCGAGDGEFIDVIDRIWDQLPGPRVRVDIRDVSSASSELDRAAVALLDVGWQREDASDRARSSEPIGQHGASDPHPIPPGGADPGEHGEHSADGDHDMGHSGHHMDHGDMDMAPAGIALAQGGEDRDGLEMDVLHVRLGPFLAYWPAGLMLHCALQGDVITAAEARMMGVTGEQQPPSRPGGWLEAARHTDHLVTLLTLAGWPRAAAAARRLRDILLEDPVDDRAAQKQVAALATLVRRSRLLRWALRDLTSVAADDTHRYGLPAALAGDTYDRLLTRLGVVQGLIRHEADTPRLHVEWPAIEHTLPALIEGLDLATARLVIAGLGIPTAEVGQP